MFTDLLSLILNRNLSKRKIEFAFIVHPRKTDDIYRKYKFLKILPKKIVNCLLLFFWPTYGGRIKIYNKENKTTQWGAIIICPLIAKQMLGKRNLAAKKVLKAAKLAHIYGATVVGLGALTSVVTDGGDYVREMLPELTVTSGNSLTSHIAAEDVSYLVNKYSIEGSIAIIGATGSIGKAVSKILSEILKNELILVGKNPERINLLKSEIIDSNLRNNEDSILATTNIHAVKAAELLVVVTSAAGAVITQEIIENTKIIYDLTQPKNTPENIQQKNGLVFVDGGLIKLPEYVEIGLDISLPNGVAFACLSETLLLAMSKRYELITRGDLNVYNIKQIGVLKDQAEFKSILHHV